MTSEIKLTVVKIIHTVIWLFFNVVIFYLFYAVMVNKIDKWVWIGFSFILLESIILIFFKMICPLTLSARKYSDSNKDNFDIFLPNFGWLKIISLCIFLLWSLLLACLFIA